MKTSVSYKFFVVFKFLGLIPTSRCKKWFSYILSALLFCALALSIGFYIQKVGFTSYSFGYLFTDATISITGVICVYMNLQLFSQYPEIFLSKILEAPKKKYVLLAALVCFTLSELLYLLQVINETNLLDIAGYIVENLCNINAELQILSFLFMLGYVITHYTRYLREIASDQDSLLIFSVKKAVENYHTLQRSVSNGLFFIFSLQTINLTISIYLNIHATEGDEVWFFWNANLMFILAYIALVADDVNQARLEFVDDLW